MRSARRYRLILSTAATKAQAVRIARALVNSRHAACVNIVPGIRSIYRWKGKTADEGEVLLIVKTRATTVAEVERTIRSLHSYEVPEIISLPLDAGSEPYLRWLTAETTNDRRK